ncbi:MAG: nucleotidyltransferase domain-containing protein [Candidatus Sericytochromatia bacterium]|nr:nucleotidyltransferase domain-containing protein [Candidatus Tanganyikabacteria bacterium]
MDPDPTVISDLVRRIRQVASPRRIILFGSAARGTMHPNSDLDVLVVVPEGVHRRRTAQGIYRNLIGLGVPVDVVVATERDLERFGAVDSMVYSPALREGKLIYVA